MSNIDIILNPLDQEYYITHLAMMGSIESVKIWEYFSTFSPILFFNSQEGKIGNFKLQGGESFFITNYQLSIINYPLMNYQGLPISVKADQ
ncbi:MAG: hypothetical protein AAGJ08_14535 [Cyanobacteria bacterium P01_H01_bin.35]